MSKGIKIAISGRSGCGNSTVSSLVAEKLGFKMINFTFRQLAEEKGMEFSELCEKAKTDFSYDRELDRRQVEMTGEGGSVLGSRLAVWMLKEADLKVYLTGSAENRVARIAKREKRTLEEVKLETERRDSNDSERYMEIYGIDNSLYDFVDLIINTDNLDQFQVSEIIVAAAKSLQ